MTLRRLGALATGLVQMIQQALICPALICSNSATVPPPTWRGRLPGGICQRSSINARSASTSSERCPGRPGPM
jgi:hypothetical protein